MKKLPAILGPQKTLLTTADLAQMRYDERFDGCGYLGHECRQAATWSSCSADAHNMPKLADEAVVAIANALGWDKEALFLWANSRQGRHAGDDLIGRAPSELTARLSRSMRAVIRPMWELKHG